MHANSTLTTEQIDALVRRYLDDGKAGLESYAVEVGETGEQEVAEYAQALRADIVKATGELRVNRTDAMDGAAKALLQAAGLKVDKDSAEYRTLLYRLLRASVEVGKHQLQELGEPIAAAPVMVETVKPSPLLSAVIAEYEQFKVAGKKWTPKTRLQITSILRVMVELIDDRPIREVSKDHMRALYRLIPQYPSHAVRHYPGLSAPDAIAAADTDDAARLAPRSQNDYFTHIKSFWRWAVEHEYIDKSPAVILKDVELTASAWDQRPAFKDDELKRYFALLDQEQDDVAMRWVPRLMLFAGLRLEEAAKLTPADIRQENGVYVIDINGKVGRLKTKNADRLVPIHSAILEALLAHVATIAPGANLWGLTPNSAGTFSAALSKRLNTRLDNAVPENEKLVTYSLRHTFATRLKHAFAPDTLLDELMGHKVEGLAQGRYGKRFEAARLKEAVELLRLEINI